MIVELGHLALVIALGLCGVAWRFRDWRGRRGRAATHGGRGTLVLGQFVFIALALRF